MPHIFFLEPSTVFTLTLASSLPFHNAAGRVKDDSQVVSRRAPSKKQILHSLFETSLPYHSRDSASFGLLVVAFLTRHDI